MRSRIEALVVVRHGGDDLIATIDSLRVQSLAPARVIAVDASGTGSFSAALENLLAEGPWESEILSLPRKASFPGAVNAALTTLFPADMQVDNDQWLWLLREGIVGEADALRRLASSVEGAPLIKIAGPKQLMTDRPGYLRELGESMTPWGRRVALAERELDQGQYDRLSDVLAVGEAGMLVHAESLRDVGGFDEALAALDSGLDLSVRIRLQGHRVVVVPRAVISVPSSSADAHAGKKLSRFVHEYLSAQSWLHRRLVYTPVWALVAVIVALVPWSVVRGLGHLVLKRPDRLVVEPLAALATITRLRAVFAARRKLRASRAASWDAIDALRVDSREVLRKARIAREESVARREEKASMNPAPRALPQLAWLSLALTAVAAAVFGAWWGATALIGGGALPLSDTLGTLWANAWTVAPTQWGFDAPPLPADPASFVLALVGSLTWWAPTSALVWIVLAALPLAGAIAWWGFSHVFRQSWTTTLMSLLWALSPAFLFALAEGRIGAVLAHLALPWLAGSLFGAHHSWQRVGLASLAAMVVTAGAPVLLPAVIVGVLLLVLLRGWGSPLSMLAGVLPFVLAPALLLALPRFLAWWNSVDGLWWQNGGTLFADPGAAVAYDAAPWWSVVLGIPSTVPAGVAEVMPDSATAVLVLVAMAGMAIALAIAVLSVAFGRNETSLSFSFLFALGLVTATVAPALFSGFRDGEATSVWPGTGVSLMVLGVLIGAGSLLDRVWFRDALGNPRNAFPQWSARSIAAAVTITSLATPALLGVYVWNGSGAVQPASAPRTLPAFVAAEATALPEVGTLVISPTDAGYSARLARGAGETLSSSSTLVRGRSLELTEFDEDLARLAAMLVRPSSADPLPLLQEYGIRFVLIEDARDSEASLALSRQPGFVSASSVATGQLWQVPAVTVPEGSADTASLSLWNQLFLLSLAMVAVLAIPTERRIKATGAGRDDSIAALGEETADND